MDLSTFYFAAWKRQRETGEREGQALFNQLVQDQPFLAESVRGTTLDPFYKPSKDIDSFHVFLMNNWEA